MCEVKVENPILRGFNPDPNILRVNDMYYIVVSSFEWLPGARVYGSTDLVNWHYVTDILHHQVDLKGNPTNGSIWDPQLSYADGQFYFVFTDVKSVARPFKDAHNYLMTAKDINGPWTDPIYLNSSGFDPSLFHDVHTGKKWLLNEQWDYRIETPNKSAGIVLQEYDPKEETLIGEIYPIFSGTVLAKTEAPHLYFVNGYYYLLTAEGGTGRGHSVTVCRSKAITGPYELAPNSPILTASDKPDSSLQCTGHGSLVQTENGQWYMAYLCTRPLKDAAILGRETAIQEVYWTEDYWLSLKSEGNSPQKNTTVQTVDKVEQQVNHHFLDTFERGISPIWNTRRILPERTWCDVNSRQGYLRIHAGESIQSTFDHHLLAIRQTDFSFEVTTSFEYEPTYFNQMAGLTLYLNEENYYYCYVTWDETVGKCLRMIQSVKGEVYLDTWAIPLHGEQVYLKVDVKDTQAFFQVKEKKSERWEVVGSAKDVTTLSGGFTGNFVGVGVHDLNKKKGSYADFSFFEYKGRD